MTVNCYVCGAEITEKQPTVAARIITPGPGLVQACSAKCAIDPKFADPIRNNPRLQELLETLGQQVSQVVQPNPTFSPIRQPLYQRCKEWLIARLPR